MSQQPEFFASALPRRFLFKMSPFSLLFLIVFFICERVSGFAEPTCTRKEIDSFYSCVGILYQLSDVSNDAFQSMAGTCMKKSGCDSPSKKEWKEVEEVQTCQKQIFMDSLAPKLLECVKKKPEFEDIASLIDPATFAEVTLHHFNKFRLSKKHQARFEGLCREDPIKVAQTTTCVVVEMQKRFDHEGLLNTRDRLNHIKKCFQMNLSGNCQQVVTKSKEQLCSCGMGVIRANAELEQEFRGCEPTPPGIPLDRLPPHMRPDAHPLRRLIAQLCCKGPLKTEDCM